MDEREKLIEDRRELLFKMVNSDDAYKLPVCDGAVDRVLGVEVSKVYDHVKDLTLWEVHKLVTSLIRKKHELD